MAATKQETSLALAALTSAALCLPGLEAQADTPVAQAEGSTEFGYYQESSNRMKVEMYHAGGVVPLNDRIEASFSLDRDTYSGATPGYNLPDSLVNQPVLPSTPVTANPTGKADVVSTASPVSIATLTGFPATGGILQKSPLYDAAHTQIYNSFIDPVTGSVPPDLAGIAEYTAKLAGFEAVVNNYIPSTSKPVQRFQSQPLETRTQPMLGFKYFFDDATLGISGGLSQEPDFTSNFGSINFSQEFNDKNTTLTGGYSMTSNQIYRNMSHNHDPSGTGLQHIAAGHPNCFIQLCADYSTLNANSLFNAVNLGFSQVLGKNTLLNVNGSYTNQSGFLSNAYKAVYVRGLITPQQYTDLSLLPPGSSVNWSAISPLEVVGPELFRENRPGVRNIFSLSTGLNQHIPGIDASVHFDYRFYHDDWNIDAHTFELKWFQPLPFHITVTPNVRYYSQSQAFYFAPYYLEPRADNFYSSDYRLSAFGALSGGITLEKALGKGVKLEAGVDYYQHAGSLKLGGSGSGDYADYSYYMAHAGVDMSFSAPGSLFGDEGGIFDSLFGDDPHAQHHHHHTHFGTLPPAGVMYGHMMHQSGDAMVGYMYMNSTQTGSMLHGSQTVSDQQVVAYGCPGYNPPGDSLHSGCLTKQVNMSMGMHMLDIMFAPTDWLNVMVMPQLMDMKMDMSSDLREANSSLNGSYLEKHNPSDSQSFYSKMHHSVYDLGDTVLMPLFKIYEDENHHIHVGAGVSAPTGKVNEVHNTLNIVQVNDTLYNVNIKVLQDYGMQAGSGTWDFKPSLTYNGQMDDVFWGAQFNATTRMQSKNSSGYALGDIYQGTAWAGYKVFDWLSGTVRGVYTQQDKMKGEMYQLSTDALQAGQTDQIAHMLVSPNDYAQNYGGHYWDIGLGMRLAVPRGSFAGHTLSVEWLQPVQDVVNGYQQQRSYGFAATWTYMF